MWVGGCLESRRGAASFVAGGSNVCAGDGKDENENEGSEKPPPAREDVVRPKKDDDDDDDGEAGEAEGAV